MEDWTRLYLARIGWEAYECQRLGVHPLRDYDFGTITFGMLSSHEQEFWAAAAEAIVAAWEEDHRQILAPMEKTIG